MKKLAIRAISHVSLLVLLFIICAKDAVSPHFDSTETPSYNLTKNIVIIVRCIFQKTNKYDFDVLTPNRI